MTSDEQAIRDMHAVWMTAVNAGDLARLLTMMSDDVVLLNPGGPPLGKREFPDKFLAGHEQFQLRCVSEPLEVSVAGDLAYTLCRDALHLVPRAGGEAIDLAGHRLTVYRRAADGRWLLARDSHNLSLAA
ncbi:YybH family protein [Roseateles sp. BYS78W]|uniref:YybH family protein n=1 Tax=Pelomonas candidula TaxID=3299025 RepID=A0ABW7H7D3_9BURK